MKDSKTSFTEKRSPSGNIYFLIAIMVLWSAIGLSACSTQKPFEATATKETLRVSQNELEAQYGLRVNLVAVTAAGGLVDVRLKVVDGEKAKQLLKDATSYPALMVSGSDAILAVPEESKAQELKLENGGMIMLLFPNTGNAVKPGAKVAIQFGAMRLEPMVVK